MRFLSLLRCTACALLLGACSSPNSDAPPTTPPGTGQPSYSDYLPQGPVTILPADPGDSGKVTVAGIDADSDGVRDDVQIFIHEAWNDSTREYDSAYRAAATMLATSLQNFLASGTDASHALAAAAVLNKSIDCAYSLDPVGFGDLVDLIEGVVVNTKARTQAYIAAGAFVSGGTFSVSTVADNAASCREAP